MLEGLCHDFVSKFFRLALPKNLVGEPFCVSQIFWSRSVLWKRGGGGGGREGISRFSVEIFLSPVSKNFVGGHFSASFISGIGKC